MPSPPGRPVTESWRSPCVAVPDILVIPALCPAVALAGDAPRDPVAGRCPSPAAPFLVGTGRRTDRRLDARRLPWLRLRPVPRADPAGDGRLAQPLAVPLGRHLHLRQLPRLPQPAQPDAPWIGTQLRKGWRLLPITLGPQASCSDRFPRYDDDPVINGRPGPGDHSPARRQGRAEAVKTVEAAKALGIVPRSTLWYDLEAYDNTNYRCRESALSFLSAWTNKLHELKYVSGVYSSAGSGIKVLDDARVERPNAYTLPDMIWIARWDEVANTSTSYIRDDGWRPGGRVKQYMGGHNETWGGVTINIDRNYLDVGGTPAPPPAPVPAPATGYRRRLPRATAAARAWDSRSYYTLKPRARPAGPAPSWPCSACSRRRSGYVGQARRGLRPRHLGRAARRVDEVARGLHAQRGTWGGASTGSRCSPAR